MTESIAILIVVMMIAGATAYLVYDFSQFLRRRRWAAKKVQERAIAEPLVEPAAVLPLPEIPASSVMDSGALPEEARNLLMNAVWYCCENPRCNYTQFLDVYHIEPQANGEANALDNLVVLCPACRAAAGKGEISREALHSWVHRRGERLRFAIDWPYR
ncbi:MAG: HNH endonuclease [Chloroflexi bacterium]|nr:HNH endonuclease [Chloroflexota bacterium]